LAHAAIEADLRVAWFTLESLTAALGRAEVDASIGPDGVQDRARGPDR
jgi:hypothetical protein